MKKKLKRMTALMLCTIIFLIFPASSYSSGVVTAYGASFVAGGVAGAEGVAAAVPVIAKYLVAAIGVVGAAVAGYNVAKDDNSIISEKVMTAFHEFAELVPKYDSFQDLYDNAVMGKAIIRSIIYDKVSEMCGNSYDKLKDWSRSFIKGCEDIGAGMVSGVYDKFISTAGTKGISVDTEFIDAFAESYAWVVANEYNADYEKSKSRFDWESLGFVSDYDTFPESSYAALSAALHEDCADFFSQCGVVNPAHTLLVTTPVSSDIRYFITDFKIPELALATIYNYEDASWHTFALKEEDLFQQVSSYSYGGLSVTQLVNSLASLQCNGTDCIVAGEITFDGYPGAYNYSATFINDRPSDSPFGLNLLKQYSGGNYTVKFPINLSGANTFVINPTATCSHFILNYQSADTFLYGTNAMNGTVEPAIPASVYSGVSDVIGGTDVVDLGADVYNAPVTTTDEVLETIAEYNGLTIAEEAEEIPPMGDDVSIISTISSTAVGILSFLKKLPARIYNEFVGILSRILSAVLAIPESIDKCTDAVKHIAIDAVDVVFPDSVAQTLSGISSYVMDIAGYLNALTPGGMLRLIDNHMVLYGTALQSIEVVLKGLADGRSITDLISAVDVLGVGIGALSGDIVGGLAGEFDDIGTDVIGIGTAVGALSGDIVGGLVGEFGDIGADVIGIGTAVGALSGDIVGGLAGEFGDTLTDIDTGVAGLLEGVTDIPVAIADEMEMLFVPDMAAVAVAVDELKSNFIFIGDINRLVRNITDMGYEPHDYLIIYNWNRQDNHYTHDSQFAGESYRIDFSWYAPYRPYVNAIIIAFAYLFFIWRIFIKIPSVVSGLAGGIQDFDTSSQNISLYLHGKGGEED